MRRLLCAFAGIGASFIPLFAQAAVTANSVILPQTPEVYTAQILPATGTGLVAFATGQTNGTKVLSLLCSSTDTIGHTLDVYRVHASTNYLIAAVSIPASSGNVIGTPPVQVITTTNFPGPMDSDGNRYLLIGSGDTISIASTVAVSTGDAISCVGHGADY
jgi:hypothetical protein